MKHLQLLPLFGICCFILFSLKLSAQEQTLPEVFVTARSYKYLRTVHDKDADPVVKRLQLSAASYDIKNSPYYEDDYDNYFITFYLPQGYILAMYDSSGKLLRTAERYKDTELPFVVSKALVNRFPNWAISKDVYLVTYENTTGAKKMYKLILENGTKRLRVKIDEKGEFQD